jgi:hypothetical protein
LRKAIAFSSRRLVASESSHLLGVFGMSRVNDKVSRGLEVPLRAFWVQGVRQKAVAGRHALHYVVLRASVSCSVVMS